MDAFHSANKMSGIKLAIFLTLLLAGACHGQDGSYLSGMANPLAGQMTTNLVGSFPTSSRVTDNVMATPINTYGNTIDNSGVVTEVSISETPAKKGIFSKITDFMAGAGGGGLVGWALEKGLSYGIKYAVRTIGYSVGGPYTATILLVWPFLKPAVQPLSEVMKRLFQGMVMTKFQLFQFILGLPRLYHRMLKNVLAQLYLLQVKYNLAPNGLFLALRLILSGKAYSIPSASLDGISGLFYTTESNLAVAARGKLGRMAYPYASSLVNASRQRSFLTSAMIRSAEKMAHRLSNMGSKIIDTGVNLGTSGIDIYSGVTSGTMSSKDIAMTGMKALAGANMGASPVVEMSGGYGANLVNGAMSLANSAPNVRMSIS